MTGRGIRLLVIGAMAAVFIGGAAPAFAQNGTLSGRVIDAERRTTDREGNPIVGAGRPKSPTDPNIGLGLATVTLELQGSSPRKFTVTTDDIGGWYKAGLPPGTYDISIRREWRDPVPGRDSSLIVFTAEAKGIVLKPGEKVVVPDIGALTEVSRAAGHSAPTVSNVSNAAADAANKRAAELQTMLKDANAAAAAGKYEEAITMFTNFADKQAEKNEKCAACYVKIGEAQLHLAQIDKAEAAFLKAIELDPNLRDPYSQLASLYNGERKFDEASKMSAKANELASGGAAGGGGGDAVSLFNAGIINWNAGKYRGSPRGIQQGRQGRPEARQRAVLPGHVDLQSGELRQSHDGGCEGAIAGIPEARADRRKR